MSIQEDVRRVRAAGASRRSLAEDSGLTEGKIWRIENKGNASPAEADALRPVLDRLLGLAPANRPADVGRSSSEPPSAVVGSFQPTVPLAPLEEESPGPQFTEADRMVCGHMPSAHAADAACLTHPRNDGFRLVSNSEVQTFKDCRRRWWLAYYRQLKLRAESPVGARAIGNRLHRALQRWYVPEGQQRVDPRHTLERLIVQDWTAVCTSRGGEEFVDVALRRKFTDEANLERIMLEGYVEWLAETGIDAELTVIASETYVEADVQSWFDDPMLGKPLKLIGKLDVRVRRNDGVRFFIDHKSGGNFGDAAALLPLDEQMLHYLLLEFLNSDDADDRCDGALYNMLRKVKRTPQAKPPFYQRLEVRHNPHALDSFRRRLIGTLRDMGDVEGALDGGADHRDVAYPRPSRDCRWKCDFFAVCGMLDDGSRAEGMLDRYYEQGDPLSYYDTDEGGMT